MFDRQFLNQEYCFETLKKLSWLNDIANAAPVDGFGDYIRRQLPGYNPRPDQKCRDLETPARIERDGN
jgi:hypothetical protein